MKIILILTFLINLVIITNAAKILLMMPFESKSHKNIHEATARALGSKGHKVTLFTPYPMAKQWPNVEWFQVGNAQEAGPIQLDIFETRKQSLSEMIIRFSDFFLMACNDLYSHPKIKSFLEESKKKGKVFDVAMVDTILVEYSLPLASILANHTMYLSVLPIPHWISTDYRIPYPLSTLSSSFNSHYNMPTNFWERLETFLGANIFLLVRKYYLLPMMQEAVLKHLPPTAPSIADTLNNVSFILTNEDPILAPARPANPFSAKIGGIHLQKPKPLPKDLEDFMQSSGEHGVILFSFGSFFDTKFMPINMRDEFVEAFARLKQKVIWKFHEPIKGLSSNVKIVSWMPQADILGHPKLRLFITHGGRLSAQEIVYHGSPMIGIALFADQINNIERLKSVGLGLEIDIRDLTASRIYDSVMTVINDSRFAENGKRLSAIFRDQQNDPVETVNYWTEYVIRHNGAPHLKNEMAQKLSSCQYLLLDVLAAVILVTVLVFIVIITIIKLSLKLIFGKKVNNVKRKKE